MIGEKISHYLIQERLGSGGMAEVYKALDERLGRTVALKFLPKELRGQTEARRLLLQEAQAASALEHPNICTIYQIDETEEGALFIAMAFYEGEGLDARIKRGALPPAEAMSIAAQVAAGLAEAHRHRIVHCDIKPANLLLTREGKVKILDFGISRLASQESHRSKWIMGTVPYMSPEQVRGEELDPRTDLWSLGVVLYQMVAGERPFRGVNQDETKKLILHAEPPPIAGYSATDLAGLSHILRWSLSKRRGDRYNHAQEMLLDLDAPRGVMPRGPSLIDDTGVSTDHSTFHQMRPEIRRVDVVMPQKSGPAQAQVATPPRRAASDPSLAILLPVDASREQDQQHLCFGIAEQLITRLARIPGLRVAARSTSFQPAIQTLEPAEIAGRLQVGTVLESSIRKFGDRFRFSARLIDGNTGAIRFAEDFDRQGADPLAVQDELAAVIATEIAKALLGDDKKKSGADQVEAYDAYLKGRYCWNKRTEDELRKGIGFFQQALVVAPDFAQAHAGLADSYAMLGIYGAEAPAEVMPRAKIAAQRALELDPKLAEVYTSRGCVRSAFDWDFPGAANDFQRALELDPTYATAHQWQAMNCLIPRQRFDKAGEALEQAFDLDPMSLPIQVSQGLLAHFANDPAAAVTIFLRVLEIDPDFAQAHLFLCQALRAAGDFEGAQQAGLRAAELTGGRAQATATLALAHAAAGEKKRVGWLLDKLLDAPRGRYVAPTLLAQVYAGIDEIDLALNALDRAVRMRAADLLWLGVDPAYAPLRPFQRFQDLLRDIGLEKRSAW